MAGRTEGRRPGKHAINLMTAHKLVLIDSSLQMSYLVTPASHKFPAVSKILSALEPQPSKTIIFLSTCAAVDYFQHVLPPILPSPNRQPFTLVPLHGKHPAKARTKNLAAFTDSSTPSILLTTDVAARGLDIPQTDLVIQIDPPSDPKVFLHRCGYVHCGGSPFNIALDTTVADLVLHIQSGGLLLERKLTLNIQTIWTSRSKRLERSSLTTWVRRGLHIVSRDPQDTNHSIRCA